MTGEEFWLEYCSKSHTDPNTRHDIWKFCGGGPFADELAHLVIDGIKTATASTVLSYEMSEEDLPDVGCYSIVLFDNDEPACIIRDTKVSVIPFCEVSREHAYKEGEDDRSLEKWKEVHIRAFTPDYKAVNRPFDENGLVVLEEFELVYGGVMI